MEGRKSTAPTRVNEKVQNGGLRFLALESIGLGVIGNNKEIWCNINVDTVEEYGDLYLFPNAVLEPINSANNYIDTVGKNNAGGMRTAWQE